MLCVKTTAFYSQGVYVSEVETGIIILKANVMEVGQVCSKKYS